MCYAHLQTCTACTWLIQVTYPRCSHAKAYGLEPPACPMRMQRQYKSKGLCRICRDPEPLDDVWNRRNDGGTLDDEFKNGQVEMEEKEEEERATEKRRACGRRKSGMYVYRKGDGGVSDNGSDSEDSDAEYMPSSDEEGYDSESDAAPPRTHQPPPPRHAKRRQSSSGDIAKLIEQEAAQRGKRLRRRAPRSKPFRS